MEKTKLSINTGLKLVVWGIPLGLLLRFVHLNFFFDFDTGFYTDGGVTAWLSLLLPAALGIAGAVCFYRNAGAFTARDRGAARGAGGFAGFSGGVLLVVGLFMLKGCADYRAAGVREFETVVNPGLHIFTAVMCIIAALLQSAAAMGLCMGRDFFKKVPLLYLPVVLWGMAELVTVYVFYAKFPSAAENLFSVGSAALMLLALFYLCQALSGAGEERALRRLFVFGGLTAVVEIPYDLSNIAMMMLGRSYFGELPAVYALGRLSVGMFLLAFMLSAYRTGVNKQMDGVPAKARHRG